MNVNVVIPAVYAMCPVLAVFAVVTMLRVRLSQPGWTGRQAVLRITASVYAAAVLSITVFPLTVTWGKYANQAPWYSQINFIPLITLDTTAIPNVIMFFPLGVLLPLISQVNRVRRATAVSALVSLCIEVTQLLCYVIFNNGRSCDINDVLANTLGGMIGYAVVRATLNRRASGSFLRAIALPGSSAHAQVTSVPSA
ncbi:VanZ family protein [Streptomyces jeddahensis]|uniref:VanZ like family protein n=1 Tax=Streptomyces jeddahensis TaxID=1716141 RepID=A0A177HL78_9ACTN|nr:VanZ family protein [Streptomyces jeddahensis]OAH11762.1 VanZ like family protein [Streptomyces jeddahensis]